MDKIRRSIIINSFVEKVWHIMLSDATYRQWTSAFGEGSYYEGDWNEGSEIRFIAKSDDGSVHGMYSRIKESTKFSFLSIEHLGVIKNGEVDTTSDEVKKWAPSFENYTFIDKGEGVTELQIDMDIDKQYKDMFEKMWDKALLILKEICEK